MSTRIHIVVRDELLREIDEARGDVPRSLWVRRAVERALGKDVPIPRYGGATEQALSVAGQEPSGPGDAPSREEAAPAERLSLADLSAHPAAYGRASSAQSKRDVHPIPKDGQ